MLVRFESLAEIFPLHHDSVTHFVKPSPHRFADSLGGRVAHGLSRRL